ncbi:MAG: bifunctional nuclease family protein [Acidobacteria bacterium]|nr:bifunctional nuclease family protein [Acidobacteriota bacterium]MCW5967078.1 bifunctional nuclease family protein [Blastocatellales bacterium]
MDREMKIRGLLMDPSTNSPIVLLKDVNGESMLPIWVGPFEANAIASEIEKVSTPRPMTHDLLRSVIEQFGGEVVRIIVTELKESTFYAVIEIDYEGRRLVIDARPSDAIALALRADCPIFVREEVIESSRSAEIRTVESEDEEEVEWPDEIEDIGDYKM